ncbi:DUF3267 domain-containing protein [Oceanobacillus chungangensis]|uniref:DUF3267 domain-containing protein n=1 Tax=Oceanobacillus chungangensis TaxID=1229152 RepID=A0A3D8PXM4_9BACI|nr:DUF3267 domain-containing protein [Oceanobacillus chungangensis]RDW19889.1 hypothetical protein CWR45_07450 [Oceanobacillus chungangensis]
MNCWKSVSSTKEFGHNRLFLTSSLVGILTFILLYVPYSIIHEVNYVDESGTIPFIIAICLLPFLHTSMHILPLIMMKKRVIITFSQMKFTGLPINYHVKTHLTKKAAIIVALSPTILITFPGFIMSYYFKEYFVYILLVTCIHIGISFIDFWYIKQMIQAPKTAYIEKGQDGVDILLEVN